MRPRSRPSHLGRCKKGHGVGGHDVHALRRRAHVCSRARSWALLGARRRHKANMPRPARPLHLPANPPFANPPNPFAYATLLCYFPYAKPFPYANPPNPFSYATLPSAISGLRPSGMSTTQSCLQTRRCLAAGERRQSGTRQLNRCGAGCASVECGMRHLIAGGRRQTEIRKRSRCRVGWMECGRHILLPKEGGRANEGGAAGVDCVMRDCSIDVVWITVHACVHVHVTRRCCTQTNELACGAICHLLPLFGSHLTRHAMRLSEERCS